MVVINWAKNGRLKMGHLDRELGSMIRIEI